MSTVVVELPADRRVVAIVQLGELILGILQEAALSASYPFTVTFPELAKRITGAEEAAIEMACLLLAWEGHIHIYAATSFQPASAFLSKQGRELMRARATSTSRARAQEVS